MKTTILTAAMREALMRAYLQIQVDEDQDALTLDYAARMSAMPDTELVQRLTDYSQDSHAPNRIAQQALLKWRQAKRQSTATAQAPAETRVAEAAADAELERMRAEVAQLTACLKKANDQAEHFERGWKLRGDALGLVKAKLRIDDEHGLYDTVCTALLVHASNDRAGTGPVHY